MNNSESDLRVHNPGERENLSYQGPIPVAMESADTRATFYKKTYLHVAAAFLGFISLESALFASGIAESILNILFSTRFAMIILMFGFMFAASYVDNWAQKATSKNTQYLALGVFIVLEALVFVPLIGMAFMYSGAGAFANILLPGVLITISLFVGLILTVFITGKDFSFLKAAVSIGFMLAIGIAVVGFLFGLNLGSWFSIAMIVLVAGTILYQTSQVAHAYHKEQYVAASVGIFASFMMLLWYVIRLLGDR